MSQQSRLTVFGAVASVAALFICVIKYEVSRLLGNENMTKGDYMAFPKRNGLYAVNIIIPLICGLLIYLTKAERTYISDLFSVFEISLPIINYPYVIRYFACDFLWTYSLFFCLRLTLGDTLSGKYNLAVITVTAIVSIVLETLQLIKGVPGIFDPLDIVTELIAIMIALLISTIIERRFKHYEEKSFT